jgi:hypothetical protein
LYIKTQSRLSDELADKAETVYYKILLKAKGDDPTVSAVTINGESVDIGAMGTHSFQGWESYSFMAADSWHDGARIAETGDLGIYSAANADNLTSVTVKATTAGTNTVTYGHAVNDHGAVDITNTTGSLGALEPLEYVAVEVTTEIGVKGWYKFRVAVGDTGTAATLSNNGTTTTPAQGKFEWRATQGFATLGYYYLMAPADTTTIPEITSASGSKLTVSVPTGATVRYLTVTNTNAAQLGGFGGPSFAPVLADGISVGAATAYYVVEATAANGATKYPYWVKVVVQ